MRTRHFFSAAGVALAMALTFSCSSSDDDGGGNGGSNDGGGGGGGNGGSNCSANFRTVRIGTQTWAAENLNCDVGGSKCYDNDPANCEKYGRLYDWATAMALSSSCNSTSCSSQIQSKHRGICPSGWHIPSNDDWDKLYRFADRALQVSLSVRSLQKNLFHFCAVHFVHLKRIALNVNACSGFGQ